MRKRTKIFLLIILAICLALVITQGFKISSRKGKTISGVLQDYDDRDWALYNHGQDVNGKKGISGIDINIKDVENIIDINKCSEVIVGVVDTGVYPSNFLKNHFHKKTKEIADDGIDNDGNGFVDDNCGWDFYNNDNTVYDNYLYDYHGTYIANMIKKVTPTVKILPCKFLQGVTGDAGDGVKAIKYAIDNGAKIINCSWSFENEETELYDLIKNNPEVLFVCVAGNSNINLDESKLYPASYSLNNVISVMSICNNGCVYEYSGYGLSVDIASPGKDIYVTVPEEDKTFVDGTSISTAYVTAAAAMLQSYDPEIKPLEIKQLIISTSQKLKALENKCRAKGCIDIYAAINKYIKLKENK